MKKKANPAEAAVIDADNDGKKRHRSKREVTYTAVPAGAKIESFTQSGDSWNEATAIAELQKRLGKDCLIQGPYYRVKGSNADADAISVKVSLRDLKISPKQYEGTFQGWKFFANGVKKVTVNGEQFADNDLLQIDFESLVDESNKVAKPRFARNVLIRRAALEDCRETE